MEEVEVKILDIDTPGVIARLEALGAKKSFEGPIEALYYDFPDGRLRRGKKVLRIRKKGEICEIVLKEKIPNTEAKINIEHETTFPPPDFESMKKILLAAGLVVTQSQEKQRTTYSLGDIHAEIDEFPGIPPLLEIEATSVEKMKEFVLRLGFTMADTKPWSGKDVLEHYSRGESGLHKK